ncbi:EC1118_1G1_4720p [Saccharomyces cerevisiae EC1118]|uniref:EC1118_1G1_4720p n=1 Tax=Saccharomyces cerevisiae (strain Lalvin EC1118 / Prise de mousse) TaxID=643680 RepID=C8Z945_YEAS8|nr:EC1118_1G1_4720p [Saccharomyces cerevisiae EC1118]
MKWKVLRLKTQEIKVNNLAKSSLHQPSSLVLRNKIRNNQTISNHQKVYITNLHKDKLKLNNLLRLMKSTNRHMPFRNLVLATGQELALLHNKRKRRKTLPLALFYSHLILL